MECSFALDQLSGLGEADRQARRETISGLESLSEEVERVKARASAVAASRVRRLMHRSLESYPDAARGVYLRTLFDQMDADDNGTIDPEEFALFARQGFHRALFTFLACYALHSCTAVDWILIVPRVAFANSHGRWARA